MKRLGILLSGRGSNFIAIADAIKSRRLMGAEIALVLSNVADAPGILAAKKLGLNTVIVESKGRTRADHDNEVVARLHQYRVDLVCLAGYMRILSPRFVQAFPQRILNIHPSLLPLYPGLHPQRQALAAGAAESGCTVHFVDEQVDHGTSFCSAGFRCCRGMMRIRWPRAFWSRSMARIRRRSRACWAASMNAATEPT